MNYVLPALALISLAPFVPSPAALLAGVALALTLGNPHSARTKTLTPKLLAWSITGLGAGMNLVTVGRAGVQGIGYTLIGIGAAFTLGFALHRMLGTDRVTSILVSAGTAICGGSAIAAVAPVVRAKPSQISVSLGIVFLLNALALIIFPPLGRALGLSESAFGLWSALAIHDTSSVVGSTMQFGPTALEVGTTVKLARALWIVPVTLGIAILERDRAETGKIKKPWFILGFLVMATAVTWIPVLQTPGAWIAAGAKRLFVLTLFLIGTSFTREALRDVGPKILLQAVLLWILMATGSLAAIKWGWAGV